MLWWLPTAERMSSLTPTVNLWLWSSWLVQRPDLQNIQPNCCLPHWRFRFHINPLFLRCHPLHCLPSSIQSCSAQDPGHLWIPCVCDPGGLYSSLFSPSLPTDLDTMWLLIFTSSWLTFSLVPPMVNPNDLWHKNQEDQRTIPPGFDFSQILRQSTLSVKIF